MSTANPATNQGTFNMHIAERLIMAVAVPEKTTANNPLWKNSRFKSDLDFK